MQPAPETPLLPPHRRHQLMVIALWASIVAVLVGFSGVLLPFVGALLVAYVIAPLVDRLSSIPLGTRRLPRWIAILLLYGLFFLIVYLFVVAAVPQIYRELTSATVELRDFVNALTPEKVSEYVRSAETWLESRGIPIDLGEPPGGLPTQPAPLPLPLPDGALPPVPDGALPPIGETPAPGDLPSALGPRITFDLEAILAETLAAASAWIRSHVFDVFGYSQRVVVRLLDGLFVFFFTLMVAAFVLVDVKRIHRYFRTLVPSLWQDGFDELLVRIDDKLSGVVRGQIVICLVNGGLTLIGLLIFKVKFALVLASVATVLTFIPIFGSILSSFPIVIVGLSQSWRTGLAALLWILGIHALEAYFLNPKILGTAARIHPALIALSLLAGERTYGFVGALFAVPTASIVLAVFQHVADRARRLDPGSAPPPAVPPAAP